MFGNLESAVRRGRGGTEKEWTDCVQSAILAYGIIGDWVALALKAEVWVEAGGALPDFLRLFFICSLFPVQQTTSGISHPVKKCFSGWQPIR